MVEFRAGRLWKDKDSNTIRADKRKGLVVVKRYTDDQLIHFTWKDRSTGAVDLDLILFPDDANWRRVKECTTGRVYVLEFKTGTRNFFWMQEPSDAKDEEYTELINDHINNRASATSSAATNNLQSLFGQLGGGAGAAYDQLSSMSRGSASAAGSSSSSRSGSNPSSTTSSTASAGVASPATATATSGAAGSLSSRLQDVMSRIPVASAAPQPRLADVVNTQDVISTGALSEEEVLAELQKHLPEGESNSVIDTLRSPQFKQAVNHLNAILKQSPQALKALLATFGIPNPSEPAANRIETFLKAILEASKKEESGAKKPEEKPEEKTEDKDSKMDQS